MYTNTWFIQANKTGFPQAKYQDLLKGHSLENPVHPTTLNFSADLNQLKSRRLYHEFLYKHLVMGCTVLFNTPVLHYVLCCQGSRILTVRPRVRTLSLEATTPNVSQGGPMYIR